MPRETRTPWPRHVAELVGVVGGGEDGLGEVLADLVLVDVDGRDEVDVADVVAAEVDVHEAGDYCAPFDRGKSAALHQRRGAVADADDGDVDLALLACSCRNRLAGEGPLISSCAACPAR